MFRALIAFIELVFIKCLGVVKSLVNIDGARKVTLY